jgi:hypothetical protein
MGFVNLAGRVPDEWYGGKVQFSARLSLEGAALRLVFGGPELRASFRLARRFGSHFVLRVRLTREALRGKGLELVKAFLQEPLVVFGQTYRFFYVKDHTALYAAVRADGSAGPWDPLSGGLPTFMEFINWFNPLKLNSKQVYPLSFCPGCAQLISCRRLPSTWRVLRLDYRTRSRVSSCSGRRYVSSRKYVCSSPQSSSTTDTTQIRRPTRA